MPELTVTLDQARPAYPPVENRSPLQHPHRPMPDPRTGELKIDPDILLKAKKFNLQIEFFYSALSDTDNEYGRGRLSNVGGYVVTGVNARGDADIVRGDFAHLPFKKIGTSGGITTYVGATNAQ